MLNDVGITDVLDSTEGIIAALTAVVTALGILAEAVRRALKKARGSWAWVKQRIEQLTEDSGQTLHEVKNHHSRNLRDDIDTVHAAVVEQGEAIEKITGYVERLDQRDRELQDNVMQTYKRLGQLAEQDNQLHRRIDKIDNPA